MRIKIKVYDRVKYHRLSEKINEVELDDVKSIRVITLNDEEVYKKGFDMVDEFKEYCEISFADNTKSLFRNSHIDVFQVY